MQRVTKNKNRVKILSTALTATALVALGSSCTKSRPLDNRVATDAYVSKQAIQGKQFYMTMGIEDADSHQPWAIPGITSDMGLVEAKITSDEVQLIRVFDPTGRSETGKVVASFPIKEHFDIERDTNEYNEKTNRVIESTKAPWNERKFMRVDWAHPSNLNSNFVASMLGEPSLHEENKVLIEGPNTKENSLSFLVETNISSGNRTPDWSSSFQPTYRVTYRTHLVPVANSPDFNPREYTRDDFKRFGFFYTEQDFEDPEHGLLDTSIKRYAQIYNVCEPQRGRSCSTNKVTWVLAEGFPDVYLDVTRKAVAHWNQTFQQALGRNDDVVVLDESIRVKSTDPKYNIISVYGSQVFMGLLGISQSLSDPRTGEKISSRVTIYDSTLKEELGEVDTFIDLIVANDPLAEKLQSSPAGLPKVYTAPVNQPVSGLNQRAHGMTLAETLRRDNVALKLNSNDSSAVRSSGQRGALSALWVRRSSGASSPAMASSRQSAIFKSAASAGIDLFATSDLARLNASTTHSSSEASSQDWQISQIFSSLSEGHELPKLGGLEAAVFAGAVQREQKSMDLRDARLGIHRSDMVEDGTYNYLVNLVKQKRGQGLSFDQIKAELLQNRESIKAEIAQHIFFSTIVHEMGHSFGLRHNFAGSADRAHYTQKYVSLARQAGARSVDLEPYAYSSIMDYEADFYGADAGVGPYDLAAIRYGYNASIHIVHDPIVSPAKPYMFCTDHQVGEDLLCDRFDKGSNVTEVVFNAIERYHTFWAFRHYRRGHADFDNVSMRSFVHRLASAMRPMRMVMDEFQFALISSPTVSGASRATDATCDLKFIADSIDAGEVANICDPAVAARANVIPSDIETYYAALFDTKSSGEPKPRVAPSHYIPYGLADLLTATAYARDFFLTVLASVEPGYYLVSDHSFDSDGAARVAPHLIRLDSEQPTEAGKLREYFAERLDLSPTLLDALVTQQLPNVVNLKVGRYVKPLESRIEFDAAGVKRLNIGSEIEKVVALNILGLRDIGVQKYEFQAPEAMAGSAYDYPTTRKFTLELFRSWLVDKGPKAPVEFVMKNGVRNSLPAPASYNKDLRMSAIEVAALELVGNNDTSMADRLRICNSNDLRCNVAESSNIQKVDFVGSNGVSAYRALQTPEGDSIAYQIVKNAAALSKRRDDFAKATREHAGEDAEKLRNQALQQVGSVERLRKHIDALLNTLDETRVFRASITDPASSDSAWSLLSQYVAKSRTTSDAEALEIRANVLGKIDAAVVKVVELHNALGPKEGVCDAPAPSAADGVVAAREISSDDGDDLASSAAAAQNGQHVAPDHMPVPSASDITNISNASNASSSSSVVQDCNTTPAAVRRKAIETLNIELSQLKEVVNQVFEFTMSSSIAPLVLKKMNDEVSRAEAEIQLLNKLLSFQPVN